MCEVASTRVRNCADSRRIRCGVTSRWTMADSKLMYYTVMEQASVDVLSKLTDDQQLIQRAMAGYKRWLEHDPACLPAHIQPEDVQGVFRTQSLYFKNARLAYPYIDTSLDLNASRTILR